MPPVARTYEEFIALAEEVALGGCLRHLLMEPNMRCTSRPPREQARPLVNDGR